MKIFQERKENLNFTLAKKDIRAVTSDLFGDEIKIFQPRGQDGKQKTILFNITKRRQSIAQHAWIDMEVSSIINGWVLRSKSVDPPLLKFSRLTGVVIDGNEVVLHLKIDPLTLEFTLNSFLGNNLTQSNLGFSANQNQCGLSFTLEYLARFTVCCGVTEDKQNQFAVRNENDKMCVKVKIGSWNVFLSRKCQQVVSAVGETCVECLYVKRLLPKRKESYSNIMKTKNCLMSDSEKLMKVDQVLKEKINASKREKYWRKKFEAECLCSTDEDHLDFSTLLSSVDPSKLKGDMGLLLEQQQMALQRKSPLGYRWHPK